MEGENGDRNRKVRLEWAEQDQEQRKGGNVANGAGSRLRGTKRRTLVVDVQEYWGVYAGESADMIWDLQYL